MLYIVLGLLGLVIALVVLVTLSPLALEASVKGQGEAGKTWFFAVTMRWLFVTLKVRFAQGTPSMLDVRMFDRRVMHRSPIREVDEEKQAAESEMPPLEKLRETGEKIERWFDLDALKSFGWGLLRRRVRLTKVRGTITYCTPDVAVTGMISGFLYTLAGVLGPFGELRIEPQWEAVMRASASLDIAVRTWPVLAMFDFLIFALKNIRLRKRPSNTDVPPQPLHQPMEGSHAR